jgi:cyclophilin family peptidyl-prolyl cis-trans isomerase
MQQVWRTGRILAAVLATIALSACAKEALDLPDGLYARIETERGRIIIELEPERAPLTTMNFVGLAEGTINHSRGEGVYFYDELTFHRVEAGFVIQGGDPNGNGTGGPGYEFANEIHEDLGHTRAGTMAMANSGPDTNGSQFYITLDAIPQLNGSYSVFGYVVEGMDVVYATEVGDVLRSVSIVRIGESAEAYQADQATFDHLQAEQQRRREEERDAELARQVEIALSRYPGAVEYENSGLYLLRETSGTGALPVSGQRLAVHFVWTLVDGTQLDSTRDRSQPYEFTYMVQRLLPGLQLAIGTMAVGDRVTAIIPPDLAFGPSGAPPAVGPTTYVVFELERLDLDE